MGRPKASKNGTGRSRKSRAEGMTGKKENEVEVRTAGVGDNSGLGLPEPVVIASDDVQMHVKAIKAALEKKDTAVQLLNGCYKSASKLNKHLPDAIRKAITAERDSDPSKLKAQLEVLGIALRETGSPIQLSVFDTLGGEVAEQAYKRGIADATGNKMSSDPYPANSDLSAQYIKGYGHGTADNMGMPREDYDAALEIVDGDADPDGGDAHVIEGAGEGRAEPAYS